MACTRYFISGRVQGVWFRESTRKQAVKLNIRGYAANLEDGRVEVLACGEAGALEHLHRWLHKGPPLAKVLEVNAEPAQDPVSEEFKVK